MQETDIKPQFNYSIGRLIMMGVLSIIFCASGFLTLFTPLPVSLSSVLFGRIKGILIAVSASIAFFALFFSLDQQAATQDYSILLFFGFCMIIAIGLAELIHRKLSPIRGLMAMAVSSVLLLGIMFSSYQSTKEVTIKEMIVKNLDSLKGTLEKNFSNSNKENSKEHLELQYMFKQPDLIADQVIRFAPGIIIAGIILTLWVNLYFLLKFTRLMRPIELSEFTDISMLNFKVPEKFIFAVITGLVMAMWGTPSLNNLGYTILIVMSVFYLFQGFGIYIAFLDFMRIGGLLRSILVVLTILTAYQILIIVGVFDMFVNFRRFFKKKESK